VAERVVVSVLGVVRARGGEPVNPDSADEPVMTVYGAAWCPHCKRVKKFLAAHKVRYASVDIDAEPEAIERLKELQDGGQIIPTVVYPDGTHEVNPSDEDPGEDLVPGLRASRASPTARGSAPGPGQPGGSGSDEATSCGP
jgi:mycoredoxin